MKTIAEAALAVLARAGDRTEGAGADTSTWRFTAETPDGMAFEIRCDGPDLPATVPEITAFPADIPKDPGWQGTHRLVVSPPLVAFDICWRGDEPLRIMTFSRGDWETQLTEMAGSSETA